MQTSCICITGIGVITAVRKNLQRQSEYRVSTDTSADCWLKLRKCSSQRGVEFQPLRKVLFGNNNNTPDNNSSTQEKKDKHSATGQKPAATAAVTVAAEAARAAEGVVAAAAN